MEPKIKRVADNKDKQKTYTEIKRQYKKAMEEGFYGEALLINYAIIEDRLRSFFYYSGAMTEKANTKIDNLKFIELFNLTPDKNNKGESRGVVDIRNLSKKITIVNKVLKRIESCDELICDPYMAEMIKGLGDGEERMKLKKKLNHLSRKWSAMRNEIVHGLMNKSTDDLNEKYCKICEEGEELAKYFDNMTRSFKRRCNARSYIIP